ncbi:MAG: ABC transporter permease, partial [Candidatus Avispirillum sp.]
DFYYSQSVSVNGNDELSPVTSEEQEQEQPEITGNDTDKSRGPMGSSGSSSFSQPQFSIVGYSGEKAMTSFADGTASITDGTVFEEGTLQPECIISEELALYNDISVGNTVSISNPNCADETYDLTVVGIYSDSSSNESAFGARGMTANDPANKIYMSAAALQAIVSSSETLYGSSDAEPSDSADTVSESLPLSLTTSATYVFDSADSYREFETEVSEMGLDDSYTVSSQNLSAYENSLTPLNTLSKAAGWFLLVILIIGAVILTTLNIFNVRERKYEIGVLTAMGMSKAKVAVQFLLETFAITLAAVIIGAAAGALSSVPVTNALLQEQTQAQQQQEVQLDKNFGRTNQIGADIAPNGIQPFSGTDNYLTEINSAADLTVIIQMLGIAILLTLVSGAAAMLFIMRCEPLQILENRD